MNQIVRQDEGLKRAKNVSLNEALVAEARTLNINVSRACEAGLENAVRQAKAARWQQENAARFDAWNDYVEWNRVPLARYRTF